MPFFRKEIHTYQVTCRSQGSTEQKQVYLQITAYDKEENVIGIVNFVDTGVKTNIRHAEDDYVAIYLPIERFNDIMTILRYESSVYISYHDQAATGVISTGSEEPVGELEP